MKNKKNVTFYSITPIILVLMFNSWFVTSGAVFQPVANKINETISIGAEENIGDLQKTTANANVNTQLPDVPKIKVDEPAVTTEAANLTGKYIVVSKSAKTATAYENGKVAYTFPVGHGGGKTPTGSFQIFAKYTMKHMSGVGYSVNSPYSMEFANSFYLHGAPWNPNLNNTSHGCVNMHTADAQTLYAWAPIGTPVIVK